MYDTYYEEIVCSLSFMLIIFENEHPIWNMGQHSWQFMWRIRFLYHSDTSS